MRSFIRHASEFPIELRCSKQPLEDAPPRTRNVSAGGLCCQTCQPLEVGTTVHVKIPVGMRPFESDGTVAWCAPTDDGYDVGIRFAREDASFGLRMVEQVCRIQRYRKQVQEHEGRTLSEEEAAREWIALHAADFPR